jgi:hypothetical protein
MTHRCNQEGLEVVDAVKNLTSRDRRCLEHGGGTESQQLDAHHIQISK